MTTQEPAPLHADQQATSTDAPPTEAPPEEEGVATEEEEQAQLEERQLRVTGFAPDQASVEAALESEAISGYQGATAGNSSAHSALALAGEVYDATEELDAQQKAHDTRAEEAQKIAQANVAFRAEEVQRGLGTGMLLNERFVNTGSTTEGQAVPNAESPVVQAQAAEGQAPAEAPATSEPTPPSPAPVASQPQGPSA